MQQPHCRNPLLVSLVIVCLTMFAGSARAQTDQRIAAVVNDAIISNQDLIERIELAILFSGLDSSPSTREQIAPQVLQRMIDERLQQQEAERLGITVSENEIIESLERFSAPNNMTPQEMLTTLARQGISPDTLRDQARAELSWVKLVRGRLSPRVVVSEAQLDMAMASSDGSGPEEMLLSEIVLPIYDADAVDEVMADAIELRDAVREGADFASLAQQVSVSGSADDGGDLGWLRVDRIAPVLRPSVNSLSPGQLSDPVRSPAGVHLFLLRERRQGGGAASDPSARRLAQVLVPVAPDASQEEEQSMARDAASLRSQLRDCGDIVAAAQQLQLPLSGDLGWVRPGDMPPELARVIQQLEVGEISPPVRSTNGFHLIGVCQIGGDAGSEESREVMRRSLELQQTERLATRYMRDLRKDGFVDVRVRL